MTTRTLARFPAALALTILAGCGGGGGASISADAFGAAYPQAVCALAARCASNFDLFEQLPAEQDCASREVFSPGLAKDLKAAVAAARINYDGHAAKGCLDAIASLSCDQVFAAQSLPPAACTALLRGRLAGGQSCQSSLECASSSCQSTQGQCGTCQPVLALGAPCGQGGVCDPAANLFCQHHVSGQTDSPTCAMRGGTGAACLDDAGCAVGSVCKGSGASRTCQPPGKGGDTCRGSPQCAAGFYCTRGDLDDNDGVCQQQLQAGAACGLQNALFECAYGLVCRGFTVDAAHHPVAGQCALPSPIGGACATGAKTISGCKMGLVCPTGACALPPTSGPCVNDRCELGVAYCNDNQVCTTDAAVGAQCSDSLHCSSLHCNGRVCLAQADGDCHAP